MKMKLPRLRMPQTRSGKIATLLAGAVIVIGGGTGGFIVIHGSTPSYFVATSGSDSNSGTDSAHPFLTFNKAASVASCGSTVSVAAGTYAFQTLTETQTDSCTPSTPVTLVASGTVNVKGVAGASCADGAASNTSGTGSTACGIDTDGVSNIVFDGVTADQVFMNSNCHGGCSQTTICPSGTTAGNCTRLSAYVVFKNGHCGSQYGGCRIFGSHDQFINNDMQAGGCPYGTNLDISGGAACSAANNSPVIDLRTVAVGTTVLADGTGSGFVSNRIHDVFLNISTDHQQCVGMWGPQNMVFKWNKLWDCGGNQGLIMDASLTPNQVSGTIEGNYFGDNCNTSGCGQATASLSVNNGGGKTLVNPLVIRSNSSFGSWAAQLGTLTMGTGGSLAITDNITGGTSNLCNSNTGVTQNHNYFISATGCSGDVNLSTTASAIWTNALNGASTTSTATGAPDLSLTSTALADLQDKGADCPLVDLSGTARGYACYPGAYEPSTALSVARLWVSNSGNDSTCTRSATAVNYTTALSSGNVCANPPKAYQLATLGDTVLVKGGTYTNGWTFSAANTKSVTNGTCNYNYGGVQNYSNCINFQPTAGDTVTQNPTVNVSNAGIWVCASGIRFKNITTLEVDYGPDQFGDMTSGIAVQIGKSTNECITSGGVVPHDDVFDGITYGAQAHVHGGAYNVWFVGGTAQSAKEIGWALGDPAPFTGGGFFGGNFTDTVHNSGVVGVTFKGYNFVSLDPINHHPECIHIDASDHDVVVANSKFQDCPRYGIRVEAEGGGSQINNIFENNDFDGRDLNFDCHDNNCTVTGNTVRFNSFHAATLDVTNDCQVAVNNGSHPTWVCTNTGNVAYGNVVNGVCESLGGWSMTYSVYTAADTNACGSGSNNAYSTTVTYTSPGSSSYDLTLSGAQTAKNYVPNTKTWPLTGKNMEGILRTGSSTNAGAH